MRAIIFGSDGRVGQSLKLLAGELQEFGHNLRFLSHSDIDLLSRDKVDSLISSEKPDVVLNLAAVVSVRVGESQSNFLDFSKNIQMQQNLIRACVRNGVKRVVQPGSYHIFDPSTAPPYSATEVPSVFNLNFDSPYAASKSAEVLFFQSRNEWPGAGSMMKLVLLPNLFGPFGPRKLSREHFIGATIARVIQAQNSNVPILKAYGNPEELREYLFTMDAAAVLIKTLLFESDTPDFSVISSGHKFTLRECWEVIIDEAGYSGEVVFDPEPHSQPRDMYFVAPTFEPEPFRSQIRRTIGWYRTNSWT